jgi:hypothetical protein
MSDINVNINNYNLVQTNVINNIKIHINQIVLFTSLSLSVRFYQDTTLVENRILNLTGTDYTDWGNDDNYIINFVLNTYGLTQVTVLTH